MVLKLRQEGTDAIAQQVIDNKDKIIQWVKDKKWTEELRKIWLETAGSLTNMVDTAMELKLQTIYSKQAPTAPTSTSMFSWLV